nr:hypothetical protein [Tanacetum cinerariifolium]
MQTLEEKQIDTESMQELLLQLSKDLQTLGNASNQLNQEEQDSSQYWKPPVYYSDDDDNFYRESIDETPQSDAIAPDLPITDSLVMEDEHLDTIPKTNSTKKLNDYTSSDDESSSEEDVPVEHFKIYSNPLLEFDEEIFSNEINPLYNEVLEDLDLIPPRNENDHFNAESDLIESLINKDTVITSPKINFLLEEFAGKLALINPIPSGIAKTNFYLKAYIRVIQKLLYDKSSPRPLEELNFEKENSGSTPIHTYISLLEYESFYNESDSAYDIFNDYLAFIISPSEYEYVYADDEGHANLGCPVSTFLSSLTSSRLPDYEDSRARGFVQRSLDLHSLACFFCESDILDLIE